MRHVPTAELSLGAFQIGLGALHFSLPSATSFVSGSCRDPAGDRVWHQADMFIGWKEV